MQSPQRRSFTVTLILVVAVLVFVAGTAMQFLQPAGSTPTTINLPYGITITIQNAATLAMILGFVLVLATLYLVARYNMAQPFGGPRRRRRG